MIINTVIENSINKIKKEVLQPNMDQIPLAYLLTRKIPDSVKHFFDQEVELWLREEQEKVFSSTRFDYDMPEVRMRLDQVFDILKNTATFSVTKFNQLLERAVKLEANYIIKPQTTLRQFLFKDKPIISTIDVYDLLRYFNQFTYYKDALTQYFNQKYLKEISEPQFAELLAQIDNQLFTKDPIQSILKIVKTILNFLNQGREMSAKIDSILIKNAFEDRGLTTHAKMIEVAMNSGFEEISLEDLEVMLATGKLPEKKPKETLTASTMQEKLQAKLKLEKIADIEEKKPEIEVEDISVPETSELLEMDEEKTEEVEEEYEEEYEEEEEVEEVEEAPQADPENLLANLVSKKLDINKNEFPSVRSLISSKNRKKFIKKLCKKDSKQYERFIDLLEESDSWKEASLVMDQKFYEFGVNPYSKEAIEFSDLMYKRYFNKENENQEKGFD